MLSFVSRSWVIHDKILPNSFNIDVENETKNASLFISQDLNYALLFIYFHASKTNIQGNKTNAPLGVKLTKIQIWN